MGESQSSQVFMFDDGNPEMQRAYESARATFRYFWREVAWERRRIIPGLDLACVKAPFSDGQRNFGDPSKVRVSPEPGMGGGLLKSWFSGQSAHTQEHPMSVNMAASLKKQLVKDPSLISSTNDRGWTLLHLEALAGSAPTVKALLEAGADPTRQTNNGKTPLQLAQSLGWDNVIALLTSISKAPT